MEAKQLTQAVQRYLASFGRKPDAEVVAAYVLTLRQFGDEPLLAALSSAKAIQREHPMSAGQLAELARYGRDADALANRAFDVLDDALNGRREYRIDFADRLINATVRDLGGRERLTKIPREQFHQWTRRDFVAAYRRNLEVRPTDDRCLPLPALERPDHVVCGLGRVAELPVIQIGGDGQMRAIPGRSKPVERFGLQLKLMGGNDGQANQ